MVECPNCKRKFIYESFQKHKKNCVMINGKKGLESNENAKSIDGSKEYKKPRVLTCCVCGR